MAIRIPSPAPVETAPQNEGWAPYLDPDEPLLWQGGPSGATRVRGGDIVVSLFGCFFLAFSLFWTAMAASTGSGSPIDWLFPLFGLPFVAVGAYMTVGRIFWNARVRRRTRYALTDRRAIIASSAFGRILRSYPIDEDTRIDYRPGAEATIWFAHEEKRGDKGRRYTVRHGFEFIPDGDAVYRLMRQVQRGEGNDGRHDRQRDGRRDA